MTNKDLTAIVVGCATIIGCMIFMTDCCKNADRELTNRQMIVKGSNVFEQFDPLLTPNGHHGN